MSGSLKTSPFKTILRRRQKACVPEADDYFGPPGPTVPFTPSSAKTSNSNVDGPTGYETDIRTDEVPVAPALPNDIDLGDLASKSTSELRALRKRIALKVHPDRLEQSVQARANRLMSTINQKIDEAIAQRLRVKKNYAGGSGGSGRQSSKRSRSA